MTDVRLERIGPDGAGSGPVRGLYEEVYGGRRTIPFDSILAVSDGYDLEAVYDGDVFAGFFFAIGRGDTVVVPFMAVPENLRRRGYGTGAVLALSETYGNKRIVLLPDAPEVGDRLQNSRYSVIRHLGSLGFSDALYRYRFLDRDFQVLCRGGTVSREEVDGVMRAFGRRIRC